jgi:hypothetical protein
MLDPIANIGLRGVIPLLGLAMIFDEQNLALDDAMCKVGARNE